MKLHFLINFQKSWISSHCEFLNTFRVALMNYFDTFMIPLLRNAQSEASYEYHNRMKISIDFKTCLWSATVLLSTESPSTSHLMKNYFLLFNHLHYTYLCTYGHYISCILTAFRVAVYWLPKKEWKSVDICYRTKCIPPWKQKVSNRAPTSGHKQWNSKLIGQLFEVSYVNI